MPLIELSRALEDYFAYAETTPTRKGRRFSISLPYFTLTSLDRFQWWYHVDMAQEAILGEEGVIMLRKRETERFRRHIERWLETMGQRLYGEDPIPHMGPIESDALPVTEPEAESPQDTAATIEWSAEEAVTA